MQSNNHSGVGTRQFNGGFGSFDVAQWLVQNYGVTNGDLPRNNFGFDEPFTNIGEEENFLTHEPNPITRSTPSRIRSTVGR